MTSKHGKVVTHCERLPHINSNSPCVHERSCGKLKILYLHYHYAYCHKTYQDIDILQEGPTHKLDDPSISWLCGVTWQVKWVMSPLQKTHGNPTRRGADLKWETPILKATWPFGHVTNLRSHDNLNFYFHYHKTYGQ